MLFGFLFKKKAMKVSKPEMKSVFPKYEPCYQENGQVIQEQQIQQKKQ